MYVCIYLYDDNDDDYNDMSEKSFSHQRIIFSFRGQTDMKSNNDFSCMRIFAMIWTCRETK